MAELTISSDEIRSAIENYVSSYSPKATREEVGVVAETGDGIARVEGLPSAMTNELLEFEGGTLGIALNLDVRDIGVVILGDASRIEEGQQVKRGDEFGYFAFGESFKRPPRSLISSTPGWVIPVADHSARTSTGGSTIVVLFEKGVVEWDEDLLINSRACLETLVRVGMGLGRSTRKPLADGTSSGQ